MVVVALWNGDGAMAHEEGEKERVPDEIGKKNLGSWLKSISICSRK